MWRPRPKRSLRITEYATDVERDVSEELALHLELRTQELIDAGKSPEEAKREALQAFGDREVVARECEGLSRSNRERQRIRTLLGSFATDVRYGVRHLVKRPSMALVVLGVWTLCIGANVAIFSLVNGILLRPLPYPEADRLVAIYGSMPKSDIERLSGDLAQYVTMRDQLQSVQSLALYNKVSTGVGQPGSVRNIFSMDVTTSFFDTLGVSPVLGRGFTVEDGRPGAQPVVILRQDFAELQFGPGVNPIGQILEAEPGDFAVVGVLPRDFLFANWEAKLWFPVTLDEGLPFKELDKDGGYDVVARLLPETNLSDLESELASYSTSYLELVSPEVRLRAAEGGFATHGYLLKDDLVQQVRPALYLLWVGVLLVLALGCINIATLLLVRNAVRMRELAIRFSVGATRSRIARQLTTESVLLALCGGVLGLLLGAWSLRFLTVFEAYEIPRVADVGLDYRAVGLTMLVTAGVGLFAGLVPALWGPFRGLQSFLRNDRGGADTGTGVVRNALVAAQVALAFVLLVGAALLGTSLYNVMSVDTGFETESVLAAATVIPWDRYNSMPERNQFLNELLGAFEAAPGVESAALANQLPLSGSNGKDFVIAEGAAAAEAQLVAFRYTVSPSYFETMGIPVVAGRGFSPDDSASSNPAVVVDEILAAKLQADADRMGDLMGSRVRIGADGTDPYWATVVGVVGTVVQNDPADESLQGAIYLPARDSGLTFARLVFKTEGEPRAAIKGLNEALLRLDPQGRFFWVLSMEEALNEQLVFRRLPTLMILFFAAVSLLLSVLGVYGVLAHTVGQRSSEIGLRLALGGKPLAILAQVLRQGLAVVAAGALVGVVLAAGLSRLASGLLYEVHPNSPWIYIAVAGVVLASTVLSCLLPAKRALSVDVVATLKAE